MNQVSMKVNQANLVQSLKFTFTNNSTFLGELMQNARRAGATHVNFEFAPETKILQVTDNGCGIDSIEKLLTVAESGWNPDVVEQEHPFGIGFLSALFACKRITVTSKSGRISVDTDHILSLKPVQVTPVANWDGLTTITMVGVQLEIGRITDTIKRLSYGFPIPVILNGQIMASPHAVTSGLQFVNSDVGSIFLSGILEPASFEYHCTVYLQGLPIYRSHSFSSINSHVVHLDSSRFYARLPDRDKLLNERDVVKQIETVLRQEIQSALLSIKASTPEKLVDYYQLMKHWDLLNLINDVPVVPRDVLRVVTGYPVSDTDNFDTYLGMPEKNMTRHEIESRAIFEIDDDIKSEGSSRYMFARHIDALIYQGSLHKDHWIHLLTRNLSNEKAVVTLVNHSHNSKFEGDWVWVTVSFCDSYSITIGADTVEIFNEAFYQGEECGGLVIMPKGDCSADVLSQVSSYESEYEEFQESTYHSDSNAFSSFVVANTSTDPSEAMMRLLPSFSGCPSLYAKSFVVNLDATGAVDSVVAA